MLPRPKMIFRSHGMKNKLVYDEKDDKKVVGYKIPRADLYLDCRVLPDPSHHAAGTDVPTMIKFMEGDDAALRTLGDLYTLVLNAIPLLKERHREKWLEEPFLILTMCAHGMHRSVTAKHILAQWFREDGYDVTIEGR